MVDAKTSYFLCLPDGTYSQASGPAAEALMKVPFNCNNMGMATGTLGEFKTHFPDYLSEVTFAGRKDDERVAVFKDGNKLHRRFYTLGSTA